MIQSLWFSDIINMLCCDKCWDFRGQCVDNAGGLSTYCALELMFYRKCLNYMIMSPFNQPLSSVFVLMINRNCKIITRLYEFNKTLSRKMHICDVKGHVMNGKDACELLVEEGLVIGKKKLIVQASFRITRGTEEICLKFGAKCY